MNTEGLLNIGDLIPAAIFYAIASAVVMGALLVVTLRNAFHCALALAATLIAVAGVFLYLGAEFLAVIQVLIYVGAIVTLIIFAVMLTSRMTDVAIKQTNKQRFPSFVISSSFFVILLVVFNEITWPSLENMQVVKLDAFGAALLGKYIIPFEVISVVLLASLIGALYIARADK